MNFERTSMNVFIATLVALNIATPTFSALSDSSEFAQATKEIDEHIVEQEQPVKKDGPPSRADREDELIKAHLAKAGPQWVKAMEALGDPYLLISFGMEGGNAQRSLGLNLRNDELSMTQGLATQLGKYMGDAYIDTEIIDIDTMMAIQQEIATEMADAGHESIMDRVMKELDVDLGIVCQFTQLPGKKFRITPKIVDPRSGRRFDVGNFVIDPMKRNNNLITAAIFEEIATKVLQISDKKLPRYNIRIVGDMGDLRTRTLSELVEKLEYVENDKNDKVNVRKKSKYYKLTGIRYDGSALDLGYDVSDLLSDELGLRSKVLFSEGEIAIEVYKNVEPPAWHVLTSEKENPKKTMFEALYRERGSPRVAVVTIGRPNYSRAIEDNLAGMMMNAGVDVVDAGQARNLIGSSGLNMGDEKILQSLRDLGGFDVLVLGEGQMNPGTLPNTTYRAMMVETGRLLGTSSWPSQGASDDPDYGVDPENPDVHDVSRYLAGSILDMFMRNHLMKGASIDIRVDGVSSLRQAGFIASSIENVVSGVISVSNVRFNDKVANFTLRHSGDIDELMASLQESISSLPIETKIDSAGPGSLKMRAKKLEADG